MLSLWTDRTRSSVLAAWLPSVHAWKEHGFGSFSLSLTHAASDFGDCIFVVEDELCLLSVIGVKIELVELEMDSRPPEKVAAIFSHPPKAKGVLDHQRSRMDWTKNNIKGPFNV